jgi:hypothetical protein
VEANLSQNKPDLLVDFCDYKAAKFAVMNWHYSKTMPASKLLKFGVWEDGIFMGTLIYSLGNSKDAGVNYGLLSTEVCELTRVALSGRHAVSCSRLLSVSLKKLKNHCPKTRLVVSLADRHQNHLGIIYQAANWVYIGLQPSGKRLRPYKKGGKIYHWRTVSSQLQKNSLPATVEGAKILGYEPLKCLLKHKYLYPLDKRMRRQILPLAKPYPKRADVV